MASYKQQGVALVLVLWIVVLLTIMAGAFTLTLQREAKLVANIKDKSAASALAEAGVYYAMLMLTLKDPEQVWKADRLSHEITLGDAVVSMEIGDEKGKIDLNRAPLELLLKLFNGLQLEADTAAKLAAAVIDWRDQDDEEQENGAEKKAYKHKNLSYGPRNAPFKSVEELQFVYGMSPDLYKKLEPMLTVHAQKAAVDLTKAPLALKKLLAADMPEANLSLAKPSISPPAATGRTGTESDGEEEVDAGGDEESGAATGGTATGSSVVGTGVFSIDANATLANGKTAALRVLARRGGSSGFTILSWKYITGISKTSVNDDSIQDKPYF